MFSQLNSKNFILFIALLSILSISFINTAWVAEDAFISFRSINQLLSGEGAVWNSGERVQVYTHPLWYILLTLGTAITGSSYYVSLIISWCCLLGITFILSKLITQDIPHKMNYVFLLALPISRAFMDYSSSGLENPLVHLLICTYIYIYLNSKNTLSKRFFYTSLIYGLVYLTRPDAIFILTPASLYLFVQMIKAKQAWFKWSLLSIVPVIIWEIFSIIYYGSPIPNTALAKVNIGYEHFILREQAINYFVFNFQNDSITISIIVLAIIAVWFNQKLINKLLILGVLLQMAYIAHVGADYMLGRFLSPSLLVCTITLLLNKYNIKIFKLSILIIYSTILLVFAPHQVPYTLLPNLNFSSPLSMSNNGFADERAFYYQKLGLLPTVFKHQGNYQTSFAVISALDIPTHKIIFHCAIGQFGWAAHPKLYIIDPLALSEPFLSRLPAKTAARVGHYERAFPEGFVASRLSGRNQLQHPVLKQLYDDVILTTQGAIWSKARFEAIWRLNTGYYRHLEQYFDRNAIGRDFYPADEIQTTVCYKPFITKDKVQ